MKNHQGLVYYSSQEVVLMAPLEGGRWFERIPARQRYALKPIVKARACAAQ
jgi:hypothetical protein